MASRTPPSDALAAWLPAQRWFPAKARRIAAATVEEAIALPHGIVAIVRVRLESGGEDRYVTPLLAGPDLADALDAPAFCADLLDVVARERRVPGERGALAGHATTAFPRGADTAPVRRLRGEQSNTSVAFGRALMLKHFRRLAPGLNPELEITRFLTERTAYRGTPRLAGWLDYQMGREAGPPAAIATVAVVQELVPDAEDGWQWMLRALADGVAPGADPARHAASLRALERLGRRTAELHLALASAGPDEPAFTPELIDPADLAAWRGLVEGQVAAARALAPELPSSGPIDAGLATLAGRVKIRHHGDFHLGQTLRVEAADDFLLIDFEGEPLRPLDERRRKHTPLRDVAGMLRSLDYAAVTARAAAGDGAAAERATAAWERDAREAFVAGYRDAAGAAPFLPAGEAFHRAVAVFELEKAAYEVVYEANHRPDWIDIPRRGFARAAARLGEAR
jgi:predicted trehalose synthase